MKYLYLTTLLILSTNSITAQKQDFVWPLGQKATFTSPGYSGLTFIDFHNWEFKAYYIDLDADFYLTHASICDQFGNLLIYSNGIRIWNQEHTEMENGFGLNPGQIANTHDGYGYGLEQGAMLLQDPGNQQHYFLFHKRVLFGNDTIPFSHVNAFFYSKIDLNANNGLGTVLEKNIPILEDTLAGGQITAVRHANGRDWWLLCKEIFQQTYYTYLFDPYGIHLIDKQAFPMLPPDPSATAGRAVFTQDGSRFAIYRNNGIIRTIDLFDFDRCSGLLSNPRQFTPTFQQTGNSSIAFSPSGRFLYYSVNHGMWQIDTEESDLSEEVILIDTIPELTNPPFFPPVYFGAFLAPDGKVYFSLNITANTFHVVHRPDKKGAACQLERSAVELPSANINTIPNFPNFRLGPIDGSPCDSLGINNLPMAAFNYSDTALTAYFRDLAAYEPTQWFWTFGDGATSSAINPVHIYADTGTYEVCQTVSNAFGSDTWCRQVQVSELPAASLEPTATAPFQCLPNPFSQNLRIELAAVTTHSTLQVFTVTGQRLLQQIIDPGTKTLQLHTAHWAPGAYLVVLQQTGQAPQTQLIVK